MVMVLNILVLALVILVAKIRYTSADGGCIVFGIEKSDGL